MPACAPTTSSTACRYPVLMLILALAVVCQAMVEITTTTSATAAAVTASKTGTTTLESIPSANGDPEPDPRCTYRFAWLEDISSHNTLCGDLGHVLSCHSPRRWTGSCGPTSSESGSAP